MKKLSKEEKKKYIDDAKNYGSFGWKEKHSPNFGWAVPFVTGHKYKIHWGTAGLDWDEMKLDMSERWVKEDKSIYFVHNFTDTRTKIDVRINNVLLDNNTIPKEEKDYALGQNI